MELEEAREIAERIRTKDWDIYKSVEMFQIVVILDDQITVLEAEAKHSKELREKNDALFRASEKALSIMRHIVSYPLLRKDVGRRVVDMLEGAIYVTEQAIKAEEKEVIGKRKNASEG